MARFIEELRATSFCQSFEAGGVDRFAVRGEVFDPGNEAKGREAVNVLSEVTSSTQAEPMPGGSVTLYFTAAAIVLEARAEERDTVGRHAAVAVHFELPSEPESVEYPVVLEAVREFMVICGLTPAEGLEMGVKQAVAVAKKKSRSRSVRRVSIPAVAGLAIAILAIAAAVTAAILVVLLALGS